MPVSEGDCIDHERGEFESGSGRLHVARAMKLRLRSRMEEYLDTGMAVDIEEVYMAAQRPQECDPELLEAALEMNWLLKP